LPFGCVLWEKKSLSNKGGSIKDSACLTFCLSKCVPIFALIALMLCSCGGAHHYPVSGDYQVIENVPFYQMGAYQCGPASLAAVLNYWHAGVSPCDIAAEIYSKSAKGTLDIDIFLYAKRKGFKVKQYRGNVEAIKDNISAGYPIIVLIDYGFWVYQKNHFMVVVGYNDQGIFTSAGRTSAERGTNFVSWTDFKKWWKKTGFRTLLISPCNS